MPLDRLAAPPRTRTAHEYVREALRSAVLDGTLAGGARLVQSELAERLGVSTTPVREALRNLASEGLVVFDPHRGALVRALDIAEVRELYELRMTLEPMMIRRLIAGITPERLERAAELQERMQAPLSTSDWAELNRDFHAVLNTDGRASRLGTLIDGLRDSAAPYVAMSLTARPEQIEAANVQHAQLVELYRRGSVEEVVGLTLVHFEATLGAIEDAHGQGQL